MRWKDKFVNRKPGYFTYYVHFPNGETWVDQVPFIHDLQFELSRAVWKGGHDIIRNLLQKGEHHWKDRNGVEHRVVIEATKRPRNWGENKVRTTNE